MTKNELIDKTNKAINELVYPKWELQKAYNYYNGVRDPELFRYLEENFGIGNPTSIEFTPLIKKHIDALIGEYLGTPILPKVSCKDPDTISNIDREKLLAISLALYSYLKGHLKNSILNFVDGKNISDPLIEKTLKGIVEDINETFISQYEIASLNVIEYIILSRDADLITKLRYILLDILNTGYCFYQVHPTVGKNNIKIEVLDPLNVFPDRNLESPYVKDSPRIVVRKWMNKVQILNKYGKDMTKSDKEILEDRWQSLYDDSCSYIRGAISSRASLRKGIDSGVEVIFPGYPSSKYNKQDELIPVYEVEWIEVDKDYVMQRYSTTRIGGEIFILTGKDEKVIRSISDSSKCSLSVNGVYFLNRGNEPYSLTLTCAHLQD